MIDLILKLKRRWLNAKATIGELYVGDNPRRQCYTLEDKMREGEEKIPGETAIPLGRYEVIITYSERFKKPLPLLVGVSGFEGIRIHPGNSDVDTAGCILVGRMIINDDFIGESRNAFSELFPIIEDGCKHGKIFIEITKEPYVSTEVV